MIGISLSIDSGQPGTSRVPLVVQGMSDIFGTANILTLIDTALAVPDENGLLQTLPALIGTAAIPVSTGRSRAKNILGLPAAEFYRGDVESEYNIKNGARTQMVVARYDAAIPVVGHKGLIQHEHVDGRMLIVNGTSVIYSESNTTRYVDGAAGYTVNSSPHTYAVTTNTPQTTVPTDVGGMRTFATGSWIGPIWFVMQLSIEASAAQLVQAQAVLKRRFTFLP